MKIGFDLKKGTEAVSDVLQKTNELGKTITANVQEKAKDLSEKSKNESYIRRLKKYNPLFPNEFYCEKFNLPNMIIIVDDAVRKGIDVCEGAIGWLSNEKGMEVLHLYDEEVEKSGIKFVPAPVCDAIYYVDRFDRNRFIQTECIFGKAHEERMAELKNIAYSLGAKKCSIEISEEMIESDLTRKKGSSKQNIFVHSVEISENSSVEQNLSKKSNIYRSGKIEIEFEGSNTVKMPELKWFANDDTIKNLIKIRQEDINAIKTETLILEGSVSATMSQKTACAIDSAVGKIGVGVKTDMEGQAMRESHSKLIFKVEFQ